MSEESTTLDGTDEEVTAEESDSESTEPTELENAEEGEASDGETDGGEVIQIGDKEYTFDDLEVMEKQQMLHADYTQKTQALANEKKNLRAVVEQETVGELKGHIEVLEELIAEVDEAIDVDDLTNAEFRALEKKRAVREKKLSKAKQATSIKPNAEEIAEEQQKLITSIPDWTDKDGTLNEDQVNADMTTIGGAATKYGFKMGEVTDHRIYRALLDAGKFQELSSKKDITTKRIIKKSKSSKPASKGTAKPKSRAELFYGSS